MFVLYLFAGLSFGLSYIFFKIGKNKIANWLVTIALFLNPFGYDLVVYWITLITHDYWMTISFMYVLTGIFFMLFLYFYRVNPIKMILDQTNKTKIKIKQKLKQ